MDLDNVHPSSLEPEHQNTAPVRPANIIPGSGSLVQNCAFHEKVYIGAGDHPSTLNAYKRSLSFPEMYSRYYGITSTLENSTCMWLSGCEEYEEWQKNGGLLWIKGKPGSGKSTLMRSTFDQRKKSSDDENKSPDDHEQSTDDPKRDTDGQNRTTDNQGQSPDGKNLEVKRSITLAFFFHGRGSSLQKTMLGFYRTVLFQLLEELSNREEQLEALSNLEGSFKNRCDTRGPPGTSWQWETSQLARDFQSAIAEVLKDHLVYLYVDALDECGEDDARHLAETFEKLIQKSPIKRIEEKTDEFTGKLERKHVGRRLHICCSCRNPPLLVKAMVDNTFQVCVERHNRHSIGVYVWYHLDESFGEKISETIIDRSEDVFMWAYLVVERVKTLYSRGFSKIEIQDSID